MTTPTPPPSWPQGKYPYDPDPRGINDPLRNPEGLTAEHIGDGFQCLTKEQREAKVKCEFWDEIGVEWSTFNWDDGDIEEWTLRCPISQPLPSPGEQPTQGGDEPCAQNAPTLDTDTVKTSDVRSTETTSASNSPVAVPSGDSGELKPCPFCGEAPERLRIGPMCSNPDCIMPAKAVDEKRWNTRAESSELTRLRAENERLAAENAELRKDKDFLQKSMQRICELFGIHHPFQLMCMAKNNEQTYTDILCEVIAERLAQQ